MSRLRLIAGCERHMGGYKVSLPRIDDRHLLAVDGDRPPSYTLDDSAISIFDQGHYGSCTANGGAFQAAWLLLRTTGIVHILSRFFLYNTTRTLEGTPLTEDSGAEPRDVFLALAGKGICDESLMPYVDANFAAEPSAEVVAAAAQHKALMFLRCSSVDSIKQSILDGFPVGFGATLYTEFESDAVAGGAPVPMPGPGSQPIGGHYQTIVGYSDEMQVGASTGAFKVRNSWGPGWSRNGYCLMPYDYWRTGLAADNWTLRRQE